MGLQGVDHGPVERAEHGLVVGLVRCGEATIGGHPGKVQFAEFGEDHGAGLAGQSEKALRVLYRLPAADTSRQVGAREKLREAAEHLAVP